MFLRFLMIKSIVKEESETTTQMVIKIKLSELLFSLNLRLLMLKQTHLHIIHIELKQWLDMITL